MVHDRNNLNDALFIHTFQFSLIGMALVSADGRLLEANPALCRMLGFKAAELRQLAFSDLLHPEDRPGQLDRMAAAQQGLYGGECRTSRYRHRSGGYRWGMTGTSWVRGAPEGGFFLVQVEDTTRLQIAESQLQDSEYRARALFEQHPDLTFFLTPEGEMTQVNTSCLPITGYSPSQFRRIWGSFLRLDQEEVRGRLSQAGQGKSVEYECTALRRDGRAIMLRITYIPVVKDGMVQGIYGIAKDVSEFRHEGDKLRRLAQLYGIISEHAHDVIAIFSGGEIEFVSPSIKGLLGYVPTEVIGKSVRDYVHPADMAEFAAGGLAVLLQEKRFKCRIRHRTGGYRWFEFTIKTFRDRQRRSRMLGIARDISGQVRAEEEIRKREEGFRNLVEGSPDAVVITRGDEGIFVNETAVKLLGGRSKGDILKQPLLAYLPPERRAEMEGLLKEAVTAAGRRIVVPEQPIIRLDGKKVWVEWVVLALDYEGGTAAVNFLRDITERKETLAMMRNSDKLSAAGQLAAGIAHEIRNPLTAIRGFVQLLQSGKGDKASYYQIMAGEIERIESIVSELLMLAKPQINRLERKEIAPILEQVRLLLDTQAILMNVQIELRSSSVVPLYVECDENQLKQVMINLLKNALEAMPDGGGILVDVQARGSWAVIRVQDTGTGIPAELLEQIGQPFYTTKESGTGLGLMVSRKIIEDHGGSLRIESEAGQGTTVEVRLPLLD